MQDNYLIEIRGAVSDSLPSEESQSSATEGSIVRVHYLVHPSVETDSQSSIP